MSDVAARLAAELAPREPEPDMRRVLILAPSYPSAQYVARRLGLPPSRWQHLRDYAQARGTRPETHRVVAVPGWSDRSAQLAEFIEETLTARGFPRSTWKWEEA